MNEPLVQLGGKGASPPVPGFRFRLTENAALQLKKLQAAEPGSPPLRIGVKGGGCSGLSYFMEFGEREEGDEVFEQYGLTFHIDEKSMQYLMGTELDFGIGVKDSGFHWNNPQQKRTCGCGESFSVA